MRRTFFIISILSISILACSYKGENRRTNWVFDQENILNDEQELELNQLIVNFEKETTNEIAIVTTDNIGEHEKMVLYAVEFGYQNGIGKKGKDNGLIIVFSSTLRETFITTGLGTEKILTDEICKRIIDNQMVPEFKNENYFQGIKNGLEECIRIWKVKG